MNQKYKSKQNNNEEISYWESMTDLMSALILIVLIIFALVLLYIVRIPDVDYTDLDEGNTFNEELNYHHDDTVDFGDYEDHDNNYDDYEHYDNGGVGGDGYDDEGDSEYQYEFPGLVDDLGKAAVRITTIDAETENVIRKAGTEFQLFKSGDYLQILCTYYPSCTEYSNYMTQPDGAFFLPEKIPGGIYYLHNLIAPEGYDLAENVDFTVSHTADWTSPFEITIPMYPSRNTICVQMNDKNDGKPVVGGEFNVIASENIITNDGTLRYSKGEVVDHIICETDGRGKSTELFLGKYELIETKAPDYYAYSSDSMDVRLLQKDEAKDKAILLPVEKTAVTYHVVDELNQTTPLNGATFAVKVKGSTKSQSYTTDSAGCIYITDLDKNTTYSVQQTGTIEGYRFQNVNYTFDVSENGTVDNLPTAVYDITNRTCLVKVSVRDTLLHYLISDCNVALYNINDELIKQWDSTGIAETITGLEPGTYKLVLRGNTTNPQIIEIEDVCQEQNFYIPVWTTAGIVAVVVLIACIAAITAFVAIRGKKKKQVLTNE